MVKGKVIDTEESSEEEEVEEKEIEEKEVDEKEIEEKEEKLKAGDILNYTKEFDTHVIDEEGNRILCDETTRNITTAKSLSLLFEIKELLKNKK